MKRRASMALLIVGGLFLLAAAGLFAWNLWDSARAGREAERVLAQLRAQTRAASQEKPQTAPPPSRKPAGESLPEPEETPQPTEQPKGMPTVELGDWTCIGVLDLPSLDLSLPVLSEWDYDRLRIAPCCYSGSVGTRDLVICGHNYAVHFSPIRSIEPGAEVLLTDVYGNCYRYTVSYTETLEPQQVSEMTESDGSWDLTLFTCNLSGATRFAVRCVLVEAGE